MPPSSPHSWTSYTRCTTGPWYASQGMQRGSRHRWTRYSIGIASRAWQPIRHRCRQQSFRRAGRCVAYFRLHGSPRKYWSRYDENYIAMLADDRSRHSERRGSVVCVRQHRKRRRHRECVAAARTRDSQSSAWLIASTTCDSTATSRPTNFGRSRCHSRARRNDERKFAQLLVEGKISNQTFEEWNRRDRAQETARARWREEEGVKSHEEALTLVPSIAQPSSGGAITM